MLIVHGVLAGADREAVDRVGGPVAPRAVAAGGLAAVVSEAPDRELGADDAVAHLDLLVALVAGVPVLPMAFATVVADAQAVREEVLGSQAEELAARLEAVADVVELRLDLAFDGDVSVAAITDAEIRGLAERARKPGAGLPERIAVGQLVAERVAEHQAALAEAWTAELDEIAERAVVLHSDEQVQRMAFLVRRDRLSGADAAVARLRAEADGQADVEYVGPLPVYSFLDSLLDQLSAASVPAQTSRWGW